MLLVAKPTERIWKEEENEDQWVPGKRSSVPTSGRQLWALFWPQDTCTHVSYTHT